MSTHSQTLDFVANNTFGHVGILENSSEQPVLSHYDFQVSGLGTGSFSYIQNHEKNNILDCLPLASLVWDGQSIDLSNFTEQYVYFEQGELLGLNLLGSDWEIIFNMGIKINGFNGVGEVTYRHVETPTYPLVRELVSC